MEVSGLLDRRFNRDIPFNQFITEQLAGDLLSDGKSLAAANRLKVATGFLALGPKLLAEPDPVKMEMDMIDEQLDVVGQAFMALTIGCARCHDHMSDPNYHRRILWHGRNF